LFTAAAESRFDFSGVLVGRFPVFPREMKKSKATEAADAINAATLIHNKYNYADRTRPANRSRPSRAAKPRSSSGTHRVSDPPSMNFLSSSASSHRSHQYALNELPVRPPIHESGSPSLIVNLDGSITNLSLLNSPDLKRSGRGNRPPHTAITAGHRTIPQPQDCIVANVTATGKTAKTAFSIRLNGAFDESFHDTQQNSD
jgi:hypothetical protein